MSGSQSWLRRTFPGPALAGLKAGAGGIACRTLSI